MPGSFDFVEVTTPEPGGSPTTPYIDIPSFDDHEEIPYELEIKPLELSPRQTIPTVSLASLMAADQAEDAPPIEDPTDIRYRKLKEQMIRKEGDIKRLEMEIIGDWVTPVDGVGVWAYRCDASINSLLLLLTLDRLADTNRKQKNR